MKLFTLHRDSNATGYCSHFLGLGLCKCERAALSPSDLTGRGGHFRWVTLTSPCRRPRFAWGSLSAGTWRSVTASLPLSRGAAAAEAEGSASAYPGWIKGSGWMKENDWVNEGMDECMGMIEWKEWVDEWKKMSGRMNERMSGWMNECKKHYGMNIITISLLTNSVHLKYQQECIPVGCVPAAHWPYAGGGGVSLPGGQTFVNKPLMNYCCFTYLWRGVLPTRGHHGAVTSGGRCDDDGRGCWRRRRRRCGAAICTGGAARSGGRFFLRTLRTRSRLVALKCR